ncbi:TIP41-like protein isoform X2 [Watersipora subatra]
MTFDKNTLRVTHEEGFGFEFTALDALKLVDAEHDHMKVAISDAWKSTRADSEHVHEVFKPFDWTFTTSYKGTLLRDGEKAFTVTPTSETIDYAKLKIEEKILFFASLVLFEDELADNGASILSLKMRAMDSGYFILLRFYLRVDNVLVRVHDTRLHCIYDRKYILREYSVRESAYSSINAPVTDITDSNRIVDYLPLTSRHTEKLVYPALDS